jgi:hypothetical protein
MHKAPGGLIRAEFTVNEGQFTDVSLSGDFFCFPKDTVERLASKIEGTTTDDISHTLTEFYKAGDFELPGITIDDWITVFKI